LVGQSSILLPHFSSIFGPSIVVQTLCHSANMKPHGLTLIFTTQTTKKYISERLTEPQLVSLLPEISPTPRMWSHLTGVTSAARSKKDRPATEKYASTAKNVIDSVAAKLNCPRFQAAHTKHNGRVYLSSSNLT